MTLQSVAFSLPLNHTMAVQSGRNHQTLAASEYYPLHQSTMILEAGDFARAIPYLKQAVERNPINVYAQFNLGECYMEVARRTEDKARARQLLHLAENAFQIVQQLNPDIDIIYFKLGKVALMAEDFENARGYYAGGARLFRDNPAFAFNLGRVYDQEGKLDQAIEQYRAAIAIDPGFIYAYNNLGLLYEQRKQYREAEGAYAAALKYDPTYNFARLNLGNLLAEQDKMDQAVKMYEDVLTVEPHNAWAHLYMGNAFFKQGNYKRAVESYNRSIQDNPSYATTYYLLAVSLSKLDRMEEAMAAGLNYMTLEPDGAFSTEVQNLISTLRYFQKSAHATDAGKP
ncbi:MAG: tetratricopeptide repeat protein [Candidatus Melainabacteria bacterium]